MKDNLLEFKATVMSAITTGVSYMLPFVVAGGILVAISFAIGGYDVGSAVEPCKTLASTLYYLGQIGLSTLMVPILGAFVAYSIADKPGICVGMYAGWIATDPWSIGYASGFLGALIGGIIAGYLVEALKKMPLPRSLKSLLPTLIIPLLGCGMIGLLMHYVLGGPLGALTTALTHFLDGLGTGNIIILGLVQGAMIAFDMGGPCNKVAYAFSLACMETGNYLPIAAVFVAAMAPPMAMAIAMIVKKDYFTKEDRSSIPGCIAGCLCMITEFAIPHAAKDVRRILCFCVGSAIGSAMSFALGVSMRAPHGGLFVLFAVNKPLVFIICLVTAVLISAALIIFIGHPVEQET